ncbi:MAG TPA: pentapeptide repeat-containing protein [Pirellulaceae bacterium]|nr:pentapeptide repeat-containing protein [Pirellulaceae bacterium]
MAKSATAKPAATTAADYFVRGDVEQNRQAVKRWNRLTIAQRSGVKFAGADLAGCDLSGINLNGVLGADGASLAAANLSGARLAGSFERASFAGATLTGARLSGCFFEDADFSCAQIAGADLSRSYLECACLTEADLTGANLAECRLHGADFTGAKLTDAVFSGGAFSKRTTWPAGFVPPGDMAWLGPGPDPRLSGKGKRAVAHDINGLMARLHAIIDPARMKRTLDMLKKEKHQLFFEIEPTMVRGIVRSQKDPDLVYSCVLMEDGIYSCATPDVAKCMGLSDEPCKHILVLVIGLARAGLLDPTTADRWMLAAKTMNPRWNKTVQNYVSDSLLKYKGVMAGEVDWRPAETIPEDFYAM